MLAEGVQVAGSLVARNEEPEEVGQAAAGKLGADERSESLGANGLDAHRISSGPMAGVEIEYVSLDEAASPEEVAAVKAVFGRTGFDAEVARLIRPRLSYLQNR